MNIESCIEAWRRDVDTALETLIPTAEARPRTLHEAMRYSVFSGGKRLRPVLCLAAAECIDPQRVPDAVPCAASVELLHTYTLIHDDLPCMDDDDLRRGRPTCHKRYGEAMAVLAGDALQALAFAALTETIPPPPHAPMTLLTELAAAAGSCGVVGGQVEDIGCADSLPDASTVDFIHRHKTGDLFRVSVRMGAIVAGCSSEQLRGLTDFAEALGVSFQVADDLLDAGSGGEAVPDDPSSCVRLLGVDGAQQRLGELTARAVNALNRLKADTGKLEAIARRMEARTH